MISVIGYRTKKIALFIAVVFFSQLTFSQQQKEVDSLIQELEKYTQKDSLKVTQLLKTAYGILYNYPDEALSLSEEALSLSNELNYEAGKFKSFVFLGMGYYVKEMFPKSLDMFHKGLDIANNLKNKIFISTVYGNIANIHADLGEFDKALENYNRYLAITREIGNLRAQTEALTNLGILLTDKKNRIDEGIKHLEEALGIASKEGYVDVKANISLNLGLAYKRKDNSNKALLNYQEALELGKEIGDKNVQVLALNNISVINMIQKKYNLAEANIKKTLKLAEENNQVEWQASAWEGLFQLYEIRSNYRKALHAHKRATVLNDSLRILNNRDEIIKLEEQYKYDKEKLVMSNEFERQQLISNQKLERQKATKTATLIGAGTVITFLLVGFVMFKRKRETQFELKVADTELKALRAQLNPHFIFNALNSIGSYISKNDTETANNYLKKFSSLMRQTLDNSEKNDVILEDDIVLLKTYLDIEQKRFSNGFDYTINVDSELDIENILVPPMILQPFVENSIWHGISKLETKGTITIEAKKMNGMLMYAVDDNGKGRQHAANANAPNKRSFGIKITKNRIDILNTKKKANASLKIIDKTIGTRVEVYLPLQKAFSDD